MMVSLFDQAYKLKADHSLPPSSSLQYNQKKVVTRN